jgi:hypothetical protein
MPMTLPSRYCVIEAEVLTASLNKLYMNVVKLHLGILTCVSCFFLYKKKQRSVTMNATSGITQFRVAMATNFGALICLVNEAGHKCSGR